MKDFEIISELNRLAGIYGYGGNVPKFTDDHWNAIFAAKQRIKDYALLTSKVKQLSRAVEKYKDEVDEQKAIAELEHATQMEWFRQACEYAAESRRLTAENVELRERLNRAVEVENKINNGELVGAIWFKSWLNGIVCCGRVVGYGDGGFVIESGDDLISAKKIYTSRQQAENGENKNGDDLPF